MTFIWRLEAEFNLRCAPKLSWLVLMFSELSGLLPLANSEGNFKLTDLRAPWVDFNIIADSSFSARVHFLFKFSLKKCSCASRNFVFNFGWRELNSKTLELRTNFPSWTLFDDFSINIIVPIMFVCRVRLAHATHRVVVIQAVARSRKSQKWRA